MSIGAFSMPPESNSSCKGLMPPRANKLRPRQGPARPTFIRDTPIRRRFLPQLSGVLDHTLAAMDEQGYAYDVIGSARQVAFYIVVVGAMPIDAYQEQIQRLLPNQPTSRVAK